MKERQNGLPKSSRWQVHVTTPQKHLALERKHFAGPAILFLGSSLHSCLILTTVCIVILGIIAMEENDSYYDSRNHSSRSLLLGPDKNYSSTQTNENTKQVLRAPWNVEGNQTYQGNGNFV